MVGVGGLRLSIHPTPDTNVKASFNQEKCAARVDAQYIYRHTDPVLMRNDVILATVALHSFLPFVMLLRIPLNLSVNLVIEPLHEL